MLENLLVYFEMLSPFTRFVIGSALALISAKIIQEFSLKIVGGAINSRGNELGKIIHDKLHFPVYVTVALAGIYAAIVVSKFEEATSYYMEGIVLTLVALIWTRSLILMGNSVLEFVKDAEDSKFDYEFAPVFENMWTAIVILTSAFWILTVWEIDVTPFLASAGIIGIAAGFAAKDTISNFFGGLALYFDNTYKLGDYVVLGTGEEGVVVDIGIRSTNLKTRDDMIVTVPNAVLNSATIINQSAPKKQGRISVSVGVSYDADIELVEQVLLDVADEVPGILEHPKPRVRFREFGDNGLQYDLMCWIPNPMEEIRAKHKLNKEVLKNFRENDVEIPFPQRVVQTKREERR